MNTHWRNDAACAGSDPELFFPDVRAAAAEARKVCENCPVQAECLAFAKANFIRHGVWGGESVRERRVLSGTGGNLTSLRGKRNPSHKKEEE